MTTCDRDDDRGQICAVHRSRNEGEVERDRDRDKDQELIAREHDDPIEEEGECAEGQDARGRRRTRSRRPSRGSAERAQFRQHRPPEQSLSGERRNAISGLCSVSLLKGASSKTEVLPTR